MYIIYIYNIRAVYSGLRDVMPVMATQVEKKLETPLEIGVILEL